MGLPRIGVSLPTFGPIAGPDGVVAVARATEDVGFHSVSATERLLLPARLDWSNDAMLPESHVWDPLEILTWAAAHTRRIRVATAVVNALFQPPIVLARRLATHDQLSRGRLDVGIGQGGGGTAATSYCLPEELVASGVPRSRRGAGFVEHLAAMRACWGPDPVEYHGDHCRIPPPRVRPKPWAGSIPLFLGALTRRTIEGGARIAGGIVAAVVDWDHARRQIRWYRDAGGIGTGVACPVPTHPLGEISPAMFVDATLGDLDRAAGAGADEMHLVLHLAAIHPDRRVALLEALASSLNP